MQKEVLSFLLYMHASRCCAERIVAACLRMSSWHVNEVSSVGRWVGLMVPLGWGRVNGRKMAEGKIFFACLSIPCWSERKLTMHTER
mmetsp:Transcript_4108/g.8387  ORF Transcript_4108/g.8387 Transcript_4108/m.8387 type:complete len:87 (-) Transcript_4108:605-865(-)